MTSEIEIYNNNDTDMNGKSIPTMATPLRVRRADIVEYDDVNRSSSKGKELLQIVKLPQTFDLPDDWLVEERSRPSNPSHKDRVQFFSSIYIYIYSHSFYSSCPINYSCMHVHFTRTTYIINNHAAPYVVVSVCWGGTAKFGRWV